MYNTLLGQKSLLYSYTLTLPDTLFSTFRLFPYFLLKKMCFSNVIWNLKREEKVYQKTDSNPGRSCQNDYDTHFTITPLELMMSHSLL